VSRPIVVGSTLTLVQAACGLLDPGSADRVGCLPEYEEVQHVAAAELANHGVQDAALLVRVKGRTVCRLFFGSYGPATRVPTASAAKWLSAGAILAVIDRDRLSLDATTSDLFPDAPPTTASITLAQLISHTSGLLWFSRCMGRPSYTLQECAEQILEGDVHFPAGTGFFYAGPPFTVVGAMAERAMGRPWEEIFRSLIAEPLGMSNTSYGSSSNPALSEGEVVSTLDDYGAFAEMVLDHGRRGNRRVLSSDAIQEMRRPWSAGVPVVSSPRGEMPYGLGAWIEATDESGTGTVLSSPGIGGFVPLVDFDRRMVFIFETIGDLERIWPAVTEILRQAREAADAAAP